ncbi:MAG: cysteine synthase A [Bacteroidetes bacterium]|nr:cysteine synthase A [Bacteroidota bacterium]
MHIAQSITDLVGNTPLLRLGKLSEETGNEIIGKLEYFNPLSSVKDRIALGMLEVAEREGKITAGSLIVEPTSGNTGIGLAFISASRGYRLILTMPESLSIERRNLLKALGAEVVLTPSDGGMKAAIEKAEEIVRENPGSFMPQQFLNPANPETHRRTTAKEILHDTDNQIDYFVSGIGTGGTITGTGEVLKQEIPGIKVIAVEPEESAVLSGNKPGSHKIQGIGAGFIPDVLNTDIFDEILQVSSVEAAGMTRQLARTEGLFVGISSGAAVAAAYRVAKREPFSGKRIVVILPDTGERYLSTWIFKDA